MAECIFCQIVEKKIKAEIVYEDEKVVIFRDINPQAPFHILAIPKKHISTLSEITEEDNEIIAKLLSSIAQLIKKEVKAINGSRLVCNSGRDAGQAVPHLHFHLLAGRKFSWPPG